MRTGIPNLRFYPLIVDCDCAGAEFDTNRRPAFDIEPIAHEAREHLARDEPVLVPPSIAYIQFLYGQHEADGQGFSGHLRVNQQRRETDDFPTPESPARAS